MKKRFLCLVLSFSLFSTQSAKADLFGGDVVILAQILAQAVQQLVQLKAILQNGGDTLGLLRDINKGINDSLGLMKTVSPYVNPGIFGDLKNAQDVLKKFTDIYGIVVDSPNAKAQSSVDQSVAEAVAMNSSIHDYTKQIDQIGEDIKTFSHAVSPGGAQKLTAESLGVVIHVLTQSLRAQGTLLKLQAQSVALANKQEKDYAAQSLATAGVLSNVMQKNDSQFQRPRF
jgi:hypothetical protein